MDAAQQVAWVVGGGNGIGRAAAQALGARGARLVIADWDESGGRESVARLGRDGVDATFVRTNVLDDDSVAQSLAAAVSWGGGLDIVVNAAGRPSDGDDHDFERNVDMFLFGMWRGVKFALPHLIAGGGGVIVNVSSIAGTTGSIGADGYGPAKHGVIGMTKDIALRHASDNIRSVAVCPGYVLTLATEKMFTTQEESDALINDRLRVPMRRWGRPEEIGAAIAFLASDEASFITGTALVVDGGLTAR